MQKNRYEQFSRKALWKRVLSVLLCVIFVTGLFPAMPSLQENAEAANEAKPFLLRTVTGAKAGTAVAYIAIHYYDTDHVQRTEYLLVQDNALSMSQAAIREILPNGTELAQKKNAMKNWGNLEIEISDTKQKLFEAFTADEIVFTTQYQYESIIGIDVQMKARGEWTCNEMELFLVNDFNGYDMEGYYGKNTFLDFEGELLCSVETNGGYSYGQEADCIYRIREDQREEGYRLLIPETKEIQKENSQYFLKLDVADVGGAGFTNLRQGAHTVSALKKMNLYEELVVSITYKTNKGNKRTVYVPMISSMVCFLAHECNLGNENIYGLGQQGTSLFCPLNLLDIDTTEGVEVKFIFGNDAAYEKCGSKKPAAGTLDESVLPQLTGIQIYQGTTNKAGITDYVPTVDTTSLGMPVWYYTSSSEEGFRVSAGAGTSIGKLVVTQMVASPRFEPLDNDTKYLVEVETDDVPNAETSEDLYMTLTYLDSEGAENIYGPVNLRTKVEDFYGDWPTDPKGGAYLVGVSSGGVMRFLVHIADLGKFTGVTLYMREGNDDYQFSAIRIYDVQSISKRNISYSRNAIQESNVSTNWVMDRTVSSRNTLVNYERNTLIQIDSPKKIDFGAASTDMVSEIEVDWEQYRNSMSYEAAAYQDLGLTKARVTYEVGVKVHDDKDSNMETGDSGSENMFYFQLVFANGKTSGYVLANQQIQAGRFRSDKLETFYISMGFDYGEIAAVRIIPDDTVGEKDSFDKLYIEYVEVTKNGSVSVSPVWRFDIDNWIDIDYRDEGAKSTARGLAGRSEGELAKSYPVTSSTYSVNLLCEMAVTFADPDVPYSGALYALVKYKDLNGDSMEKTIDVGRAMFVYQGRESAMADFESTELPYDPSTSPGGEDLKDALSSANTKGVALDPTTMLRENETSRFMVSLTEPKSITSITFYTHTRGYTQAKFSFSVSKILSGNGDVYLDEDGSYIRDYGMPTLLAEGIDPEYQLLAHADSLEESLRPGEKKTKINIQAIPVLLTDNEIEISADGYAWKSLLGREPASINDELNVYVYMQEPISSIGIQQATPISEYDLQLEVSYTKRDSTGQMVPGTSIQKVEAMNRNNGKNMFYVKGISVSGLNSIDRLNLWAYKTGSADIEQYKCYANYIVVERVRDGVVLDTQYASGNYNVNNVNGSAVVKLSGNDSSSRNSATKQKVMIQISEDTVPFTVTRDKTGYSEQDIIVSLQYHTTNMFTDSETINSKNVFVSDMLAIGESMEVNPGDILSFDFDQDCLDGISSVTLSTSSGEMSVGITGLCVYLYDKGGTCTDCYGKVDGSILQLRTKTQTCALGKNSMVPVTLEITTAAMQNEENTSCRVPLSMRLVYEDGAGSLRERYINDVSKYVQSGSLNSGDTATVSLLLQEFKSMHTATFILMDNKENVIERWKPEKIVFRAGGSAETAVADRLCILTSAVYEGTPYTVNLSDISLAATVTPGDDTAQITMGNTLELLIESGESVRFTPYSTEKAFVIGSFEDVDVEACLVVDEATSLCNDYLELTYVSTQSGLAPVMTGTVVTTPDRILSEFVFKPAANTTAANQKYKVVITSQEVSTKSITVNITVLPEPEPEPETDDENDTGETVGGETSGDNTGTGSENDTGETVEGVETDDDSMGTGNENSTENNTGETVEGSETNTNEDSGAAVETNGETTPSA